jgi:uncharacterized protein (DUF2147 family)
MVDVGTKAADGCMVMTEVKLSEKQGGANSSYDREFQLVRIGSDVKFVDVSNTSVNVFSVNQATGAMTLAASIAATTTSDTRSVGVWENADGGYTVTWGLYSTTAHFALAFNANNTVKTPVYSTGAAGT